MAEKHDCLFCSIIAKEIPAKIIAENTEVLAFQDINPMANIHFLIVPKIHIEGLNNLSPLNAKFMGDMFMMAQELARKFEVDNSGYRLVINTGKAAGQTVFHLHAHLMAGREFSWPPG